MRYPEFLKQGGRIGLVAPSFSCSIEPYISRCANAIDRFRAMGYSIVEGPNCSRSDGVGKSSSARNCGEELNDFLINDRSDIVVSVGGGETMCEDLEFVDFDAIAKARPKWFMGYSDNTNMVFTLPILTDTAAIYGINFPDFGMEPWHRSVQDHLDLLTGRSLTFRSYPAWEMERAKTDEDPLAPYNASVPSCVQVFPEDRALFSGRLVGGCLDVLATLCGTKYDKVSDFCDRYADDGIVWFLEACDMGPMSIRRALWQLRSAGWFRNAKGFIFGRPRLFDEQFLGVDRIQAVTDAIGGLGLPIVLDADIGHLPPMMPIVAGSVATVRAGAGDLEIRMELK